MALRRSGFHLRSVLISQGRALNALASRNPLRTAAHFNAIGCVYLVVPALASGRIHGRNDSSKSRRGLAAMSAAAVAAALATSHDESGLAHASAAAPPAADVPPPALGPKLSAADTKKLFGDLNAFRDEVAGKTGTRPPVITLSARAGNGSSGNDGTPAVSASMELHGYFALLRTSDFLMRKLPGHPFELHRVGTLDNGWLVISRGQDGDSLVSVEQSGSTARLRFCRVST